ncbi:aminotransferase class IV [Desmospora profundinema]|uniref:Branched-subunit amino acid aminotransferase/4-amino-4-deoxychorismate lyase n=1 Tax=Desmospora profundinema TaxID=1571184 RepID=A0ABU1IMG8_9BACL|nr:aminotransferase class IV [Desmospora profundinema]MDR6225973.1 branched-subunit amino acid aminotransferase/4-amino-4-deoxychorismate lyase [Desmospora profundinema]
MKWIVNGQVVEDDGGLSPADRGSLLGDGLFETFRVERGVPLLLEKHMDRLMEGTRILRFARVPAREELAAGIRRAIAVNEIDGGYLRLTLTRGRGGLAQPLTELTDPAWWVEARPLALDPRVKERGVTAVIASTRLYPDTPLRRVKSLSFLENVLAKQEARDRGAQEALFLTTDGDVMEGASANLFLVKEGILSTPSLDRGPLPGVVRSWVLETAVRLDLAVEERRVKREELDEADELFLTNSTWGPFPCVAVNGSPVGDGLPGTHTRRWMERWEAEVAAQIGRDQ